jgi:hypothetical protein
MAVLTISTYFFALSPISPSRRSAATSVARASYFALKAVVGTGASDATSTFAGE